MNGMRCIGMQAIYSTYTAFFNGHMIGDLNLIILPWAVIHQLRLELFTSLKKTWFFSFVRSSESTLAMNYIAMCWWALSLSYAMIFQLQYVYVCSLCYRTLWFVSYNRNSLRHHDPMICWLWQELLLIPYAICHLGQEVFTMRIMTSYDLLAHRGALQDMICQLL